MQFSSTIFVTLGLVVFGGCKASRARTQPTNAQTASAAGSPPVVAEGALPDANVGFLGVVVAPQTVDVTSQLEGRLLSVDVRVGDKVARGALLGKLDVRSARQDLAIASAELATAEADLDRAHLDLAQATERVDRRSTVVQLPTQSASTVSQEELAASKYAARTAVARVASSEAAVAAKRAHLEQITLAVSEGALRAPFDGVVVTRYVDAGSAVHRGMPVVRLLESGDLKTRFAISEEDADRVSVGTPVRITVGEETFAGQVEKVAPEVDAASRMIFSEASLSSQSDSHRLRSGQVAHVFLRVPLSSSAR